MLESCWSSSMPHCFCVCSGNGSSPTATTHSSHGSVHQLQSRESEDVSSWGLSPQEGWHQEHTAGEETVIEAKTNRSSLSWIPTKQCLQWTQTLNKHSRKQILSFLWAHLIIHRLRLQGSQKDLFSFSNSPLLCPFASLSAALTYLAQSNCFPLALLQEQGWCQCSWLDPSGGNKPFPTAAVG